MVGGFVAPGFELVQKRFRENFANGSETAGASFAVYHNGELIVDLYGGIANEETGQKWTQDTMTVIFSTTKSVAATVLAHVMAKENISYNTKVSEIWPEFAANGKQNITILEVTLHQAGLIYSEEMVTPDHVKDWKKMSKYFENMTPVWTPGERAGYHTLTIGFLFDQIVRRIDSQKRGLVDVLDQDLLKKYHISDLSFGLKSKEDSNRVALLVQPSDEQVELEGKRNPEALRKYMAYNPEHYERLYDTWPWITTDDYNKLENRLLAMPSNMGIGSGRSLAQFHSLMAQKEILRPYFYDELLVEPVLEHEMDVVNGYEESKGFGWQFTRNPQDQWVYGHSGFGGQNVRVDVHNGLSYAYVTNALKIADADEVETWKRLVEALYKCI